MRLASAVCGNRKHYISRTGGGSQCGFDDMFVGGRGIGGRFRLAIGRCWEGIVRVMLMVKGEPGERISADDEPSGTVRVELV